MYKENMRLPLDPEMRKKIVELSIEGYAPYEIVRKFKKSYNFPVSYPTVKKYVDLYAAEISAGKRRKEVEKAEENLRDNEKLDKIIRESVDLSIKSLKRINEKLESASASQSAVILGILVDKFQKLLEIPQNISIRFHNKEDMIMFIRGGRDKDKSEAIDVKGEEVKAIGNEVKECKGVENKSEAVKEAVVEAIQEEAVKSGKVDITITRDVEGGIDERSDNNPVD